ncbi:hypothetical protein [Metabacillus fastidiosus]|uniref:hypothetical protein n=1 Tax=Metabacillus fastidiosus TaxID=1458 RepID=UPI003D2B4802
MKNLFKFVLAFALILSVFTSFSTSTTEAASYTSYKLNSKKVYTYHYSGPEGTDETYTAKYVKKYKKGDLWLIGETYEVWEEDKNGLRIGTKDSDYDDVLWYDYIPYPVKKGNKWKDADGVTIKITSTSKTIKTKAGTFKNCIAVDGGGYATFYYAKGIGLVYIETKSGYIQELVKLKNK